MPPRVNIVSIFFAPAILFGGAGFADAVDESLKRAMHDCVSQNADRIGSPLSDIESWASFAALTAGLSFSVVKISGLDGHPDIQSALGSEPIKILVMANFH